MSNPKIFTIDFVTERLTRGVPRWAVHKIDEDGVGHGHIFPKDTLEWRAAEYGITDVEELLDIVLHEVHLPDVDRDDVAARKGFVTSTSPDAEPIQLFNATSTTEACDVHRLRIAHVKETLALVGSASRSKNPLDAILLDHGVTPQGLRKKREKVDILRWSNVYGELPVSSKPKIIKF